MKNILKNKIIKRICIVVFIIYISIVFINQQRTINSYSSQRTYYLSKIEDANKYNKTLVETKDNFESYDYIESICREKLDMYSENERVYININN